MECYCFDKTSLETFLGHCVWSCRDQYTGQKSEFTIKEVIKENVNIKKRNGEQKYFDFFYLFCK